MQREELKAISMAHKASIMDNLMEEGSYISYEHRWYN